MRSWSRPVIPASIGLATLVALVAEIDAGSPISPLGGSSVGGSPQVAGVRAFHRAGQTFVTWQELGPAPKDDLTVGELRAMRRELIDARRIRYRVYRAKRPIRTVADATLVGEAMPLSAWNADFYGMQAGGATAMRYVIEEKQPALASGIGLFVHNPGEAGEGYYAVAVSTNGAETTSLSDSSSTTLPVTETVGLGAPVLQRVESPAAFQYINQPSLRYYVRWEPQTHSSVPGRPFDYVVAVPQGVRWPAPVGIHLHAWGGSLRDGYGWWFNAEQGAVLVASNEIPYDWWTGYHERLGRAPLVTPEDWKNGVVRPFTQRRLLSFVDWLATTMKLDLSRLFAAGLSMGGSGAIMLAIRHPSRVAWAVSLVGVHVPFDSPQFRSSYEQVYGKREWGVQFEDGTPVWDHFSDVWYLRQHPEQSIGFITFSNGKNDSNIGWPQAVDFFRALQETRQPHLFVWGREGHGQRARMPDGGGERNMPLDLRTNQSLPAFTRGSLDDDPGNGTPDSGQPEGQANAYLTWRPQTIVDETDRWSIVLAVTGTAPQSTATTDVTPRRLQHFKLRPGDGVEWTNSAGGSVIQRGDGTADQWGLVTLPRVQISQGGNRILVSRKR